jgi:hypothetical protein
MASRSRVDAGDSSGPARRGSVGGGGGGGTHAHKGRVERQLTRQLTMNYQKAALEHESDAHSKEVGKLVGNMRTNIGWALHRLLRALRVRGFSPGPRSLAWQPTAESNGGHEQNDRRLQGARQGARKADERQHRRCHRAAPVQRADGGRLPTDEAQARARHAALQRTSVCSSRARAATPPPPIIRRLRDAAWWRRVRRALRRRRDPLSCTRACAVLGRGGGPVPVCRARPNQGGAANDDRADCVSRRCAPAG